MSESHDQLLIATSSVHLARLQLADALSESGTDTDAILCTLSQMQKALQANEKGRSQQLLNHLIRDFQYLDRLNQRVEHVVNFLADIERRTSNTISSETDKQLAVPNLECSTERERTLNQRFRSANNVTLF
ncbi:hypothetical protein [Zhongshania aliphaticivorans]|uniref:hypothetical protein n=1 Tax=Zhongshania aliphaticivorans TaxID=1470434 RepID=UPI0012E5D0E1|nr:hypothetical protein [Zhongshania aliphaticivorans]CAA0107784.1 Uncharacterised protein [Zhongshania aliphaticivorans]